MKALSQTLDRPLESLLFILVIGASIVLLATRYYLYSIIPGLILIAFLILGHRPQIGYYFIVFLIPYAALRGRLPWMIGFGLLVLISFQILFQKQAISRLRSNLWPWLVILFFISLFSAYQSIYRETSFSNLLLLVASYMFILLTFYLLSHQEFFNTLPIVLVLSISISCALGLIINTLKLEHLAVLLGTPYWERLVGGTLDPNNFSLMIVFNLPILAHLFFRTRRILVKALLIAVTGVNLTALVLTYSRGGAIVFSITFFFLIIAHIKRFRPKYFGALLAFVIAAFLVVLLVVPASYWERQRTATQTKTDVAVARRIAYYHVAMDEFKNHPILGGGPGTFLDLWLRSKYFTQFGIREEEKTLREARRHAHNTYLEHLVGTGILGLITFLILLAVALRNFSRAKKNYFMLGKEEMLSMVTAYQISFLSILLYLFFFSDVYHKYLLLSLGLSQVALNLSKETPIEEPQWKF